MTTILINLVLCHCKLLRRYREHLPTLEKTESKVFYQLRGGKQLEDAPASLPPFRSKPLVLFVMSKDLKASLITPSQWTAKIARKLPRSYLPPCHGLLPGAWLPRRWSTHATTDQLSSELQSSRKTWGYFTVLITWKITIALWRSQSLSSFSFCPSFLERENIHMCSCTICCTNRSFAKETVS